MNSKGMSILAVVVICCSVACSIKEDRADCPCVLVLDLSKLDASITPSADVEVVSSVGHIYNGNIQSSEYDNPYYLTVPRDQLTMGVSCGSEGCFKADYGFVVEKGSNYPPLYLYSACFDAKSELIETSVVMHKEHCNVNIRMNAYEHYPFSVVVEGDICGVGLDGKPVPGEYRYAPAISHGGYCSVRVPRQLSSSLVLTIADEKDVLRSFALGEYILESGYDWSAKDLEDIDIEIDYYKTEVVFSVNDWETTINFDVEI